MRRRQYLTRLGAGASVGVTGLAGCASPGQDGGDGGGTPTGDQEEDTPTEEQEDESTPTEEQGDEETPTEEGEETEAEETDGESGGAAGEDVPTSVDMITDGQDYIFDPIGLYVEPGTEITWVNESGSHSSTAYTEENDQSEVTRIPEDAEGWDSGILSEEGGEFSHTFETEGTYDYYCTPHKTLEMVARIVVGEPSGLEDDPPDGAVPDEQTIVDEGSVPYDEFEG